MTNEYLQTIGDRSNRESRFDENLANELNRKADEKERRTELEKGLERLKRKKGKKEKDGEGTEPRTEPKIETLDDYWRIEGVNYRGNADSWDLSKKFLSPKTQEKHSEYARIAIPKGEFYTPSMELSHSIISALYNAQGDAQTEKIRKFIDKEIKARWLITSTRMRHSHKGKDLIIHDYKMPDEREIDINFIGKDELVKNSQTPEIYKALLGTDDLDEINKVYQWLSEIPVYFWRLNAKTKDIEERAARLYADSNVVILNCDGSIGSIGASLGVRRAQKNLGN